MKRLSQMISGGFIAFATVFALPALTFAHVVVTPAQAGIGESTMFNISIPNEKEVAVTSIKLLIPAGVQNVQPDVTAGWAITTTTTGENISSITWTGTIPVGQRADLTFRAETPATAGSLDWKAYQTYSDGTVVKWDQNPSTNGVSVEDNAGPYSVTRVVNDLASSNARTSTNRGNNTATLALIAAIAALIFSLFSLFMRRRRS